MDPADVVAVLALKEAKTERDESHDRIPWITAVTVDMTTSEPTLQDVKLKPLSNQEIKEAHRLDVLINLVTYYKSIGVKPYGKHWCVTLSVLIATFRNEDENEDEDWYD